MAQASRQATSGQGLRAGLVWLCGLLAFGVVVLAVHSFWRADEAAYCTWKPKAGTNGIDRRTVFGSNHAGIFLLCMVRDIPKGEVVDWYGGQPTEVILRSTPKGCLADSAIKVAGNTGFQPRPRWLYGGFNLRHERRLSATTEWTFAAVVVPNWLPLLTLLWPAFVVLRRTRTLRRRRRKGLCLYCGYDLRASGSICSECGRLRAELRPVPTTTKPLVSRRIVWTACGAITAISLALACLVPHASRPDPGVRLTPDIVLSADHLPKRIELDLGKGVMMPCALIPAGHFQMGAPLDEEDRKPDETPHQVTISKPFYMGITLVTQEQYEAVMGGSPSYNKQSMNPEDMVSWYDATAFCAEVSRQTSRQVRLPTEAQWECACRAGTTSPFNTGNILTRDMADVGFCIYPSSRADQVLSLRPVASFKPNAWGLYDMHGGLDQWCEDWYADYPPTEATDPAGPKAGWERVERGGSWCGTPWGCRAAARQHDPPGRAGAALGFRVVMDPFTRVPARPLR